MSSIPIMDIVVGILIGMSVIFVLFVSIVVILLISRKRRSVKHDPTAVGSDETVTVASTSNVTDNLLVFAGYVFWAAFYGSIIFIAWYYWDDWKSEVYTAELPSIIQEYLPESGPHSLGDGLTAKTWDLCIKTTTSSHRCNNDTSWSARFMRTNSGISLVTYYKPKGYEDEDVIAVSFNERGTWNHPGGYGAWILSCKKGGTWEFASNAKIHPSLRPTQVVPILTITENCGTSWKVVMS